MDSQQLKSLDHEYIAGTYGRFNLAISHAKGVQLWDFEGKRYLDLTSGIGVNSLGFADEQWVAAVAKQAATLQHTSNLYYTEPCVQLAKRLCHASEGIFSKVFFANSGAEANEGAIKLARKYSFDRYGQGRSTIITLHNSFHGRTISTLAATGQDGFHQFFFPFTEGFEHLPANDLNALESRLNACNDVCAVMVELVQGEGGVLSLSSDYVQALQRFCSERDILLLIDEVQTGIGRTGSLFAYQQFGLTPDVVTLAKGLGGGLPIGAILMGSRCEQVLSRGDHGSTFGGNPVCCAGANIVLDRMDEAFFVEVRRKGEYIRQVLSRLPKVKSISGMGLMLGIELTDQAGVTAAELVVQALEKGVLLLTAKYKIRLLPPLTITDQELDECLSVLSELLS